MGCTSPLAVYTAYGRSPKSGDPLTYRTFARKKWWARHFGTKLWFSCWGEIIRVPVLYFAAMSRAQKSFAQIYFFPATCRISFRTAPSQAGPAWSCRSRDRAEAAEPGPFLSHLLYAPIHTSVPTCIGLSPTITSMKTTPESVPFKQCVWLGYRPI